MKKDIVYLPLPPEKEKYITIKDPVIEKRVKKIWNTLAWRLNHVQSNALMMSIFCNPHKKVHTIYLKDPRFEWSDILYLHELSHAVLAERHHLLGGVVFVPGTKKKDILEIIRPLRTAADWLTISLMARWCRSRVIIQTLKFIEALNETNQRGRGFTLAGGLGYANAAFLYKDLVFKIPDR